MLALPACQGNGSATPSPSNVASAKPSATPHVEAFAAGCAGGVASGTHRLDVDTVMPGLQMTVPSGWTCAENSPAQFSMTAPNPNESVLFWKDMVAVRSSGAGHGQTVLKNVGSTPHALVEWLTHNPDFVVLSHPSSRMVGDGIAMTSLVVGVSPTVDYGDHCPAPHNRCADMFVNPRTWGPGEWYGLGGRTEDRLYIGTIRGNGRSHTFMIDLDAGNGASLRDLEAAAAPILSSLSLPSGWQSS
jgi:hypothetical protein